ncbi:NlpC/P60 family protein [Cytobacillus spongiae]|uniref:C40 family peptidase n=1 Tax=Cytobacillus spongiae TaxID=2901381 RepID=UPI001F28AC80|nr:C40 family peptidase [Cytobacillus spongiae]UII55692.1 NlpC/P60 family protein [Cytobacillus spongiae]
MKRLFAKLIALTVFLSLFSYNSALAATKQEEILTIAQEYLGVPYKYAGVTPSGFDCSGYTYYIFNKIGIDLPRSSSDQYTVGNAVKAEDLAIGDLVFFEKTYNKAGITHVGMYIGDNNFISATSSKGIKVDSLDSSYWGPKYVGAKRVLPEEPKQGEFTDLDKSHPAYQAIYTLSTSNIIAGFEDATFKPESPVTRGQAAAIMNRVLQAKPKNLNAFKDVPTSSRFASDIAAIKEAGIITGFKDGTFRPDEYMTRAEMAVIVKRAFKLTSPSISTANDVYVDIAPGYWAYDAILTMNHIDETSIFDGNKYYATHRATRSVFSAAIYNSMNALK